MGLETDGVETVDVETPSLITPLSMSFFISRNPLHREDIDREGRTIRNP